MDFSNSDFSSGFCTSDVLKFINDLYSNTYGIYPSSGTTDREFDISSRLTTLNYNREFDKVSSLSVSLPEFKLMP